MQNPDEIGAASVDYTMFSGYVALGWKWARMAQVANRQLQGGGTPDAAYYEAKLATARFYFTRVLPRAGAHANAALAGADTVMADL